MSSRSWAVLLTVLGACRAERQTAATPWHDASPHAVRMVPVALGTSLEVLDWGGHGRSLVLLAGLGNTAHVFDDLAPSLTDSFRVYGITRRGFGRSTQPPDSDVASLVSDLRIVLDSLPLSKVILVGHSIAGDELSAFAGSNPDRCQALVYLEAAYDHTQSATAALRRMHWPHRPAMTPLIPRRRLRSKPTSLEQEACDRPRRTCERSRGSTQRAGTSGTSRQTLLHFS